MGVTDDFLNKMGLGTPTHLTRGQGSIVPMISVTGLTAKNLMIGDNVTKTVENYEQLTSVLQNAQRNSQQEIQS